MDIQLPTLFLNEDTQSLSEVFVKRERLFMERKADRVVLNVQNSVVGGGDTATEILEKAL